MLCNFATSEANPTTLALLRSWLNLALASWPAKVLALLAGVVTARADDPQASGTAVLAGSSPAALPDASAHVLTPWARTSSFQWVVLVLEVGRTV